jgi:hypothetical protein
MSGFMDAFGAQLGQVIVHTTEDGGHPIEFFAHRITDRIIFVGNQTEGPIREQALEYRERIYAIVLHGLKRAISSDRTYRPQRKD